MKPIRLLPLLAAIVLLANCTTVPETPAPEPIVVPTQLTIGSGDQLTITVLDQADLTGTYTVTEAGNISMPLIGSIGARGRTTTSLAEAIEASLRNGYLRAPDVTVQVAQYRPIFVMGEVGNAGQYPYVVGLTVQQAIATAGGFGPRANQYTVEIVRPTGQGSVAFRAELNVTVLPGDTITVRQRLF